MAKTQKDSDSMDTLQNDKLDRNDADGEGWPTEWAGTAIKQSYTKNQGD